MRDGSKIDGACFLFGWFLAQVFLNFWARLEGYRSIPQSIHLFTFLLLTDKSTFTSFCHIVLSKCWTITFWCCDEEKLLPFPYSSTDSRVLGNRWNPLWEDDCCVEQSGSGGWKETRRHGGKDEKKNDQNVGEYEIQGLFHCCCCSEVWCKRRWIHRTHLSCGLHQITVVHSEARCCRSPYVLSGSLFHNQRFLVD